MSSKPLWLDVVHRLERSIGERVESAVRTDTYFDAVTTATRTAATLKRTAEAMSRRALHLVNLPAGSDVRRVREQLSRIERRLNALSEHVADLDETPRQRSGAR